MRGSKEEIVKKSFLVEKERETTTCFTSERERKEKKNLSENSQILQGFPIPPCVHSLDTRERVTTEKIFFCSPFAFFPLFFSVWALRSNSIVSTLCVCVGGGSFSIEA